MTQTKANLIFSKLKPILLNEEFKTTGRLKIHSSPFMPLVIEQNEPNYISLTHYYESNGDLVPDPDMVVKFDMNDQTAEAISYQDSYSYQDVRNEMGMVADFKLQNKLNGFLLQWLHNLTEQDFFEELKKLGGKPSCSD